MSGSNDKDLCRLLYAYELGLLAGEQLDDFEIHLIDCPHCQKEAGEFLPATQLLKRDREVRGLVEGLDQGVGSRASTRRHYLQALVAVAAVVIFLVLKPWNIEFKPTHQVIAAENRLAVLYLGGPSETEEERALGQTVAGLLTADLSESDYLQVISTQRLYDVARRMDLMSLEQIDVDNATAIANEAAARWVLFVRQATDRGERRLITQIAEVASGEVVASQEAGADTSVPVFSLVDDLTVQLKTDLGLPSGALSERDPKVAEVTSRSVKAYELYLKGVELANMYYFDDARETFFKAIKLDSSLAMAYYYLSKYDTPAFIKKAVEYLPRSTRKEQMYILSRSALLDGNRKGSFKLLETLTARYPDEKDAFFQLGQLYYTDFEFETAISYYRKVLEIDPQFRQALNEIAYSYDNLGRVDEAFKTLDEYQRIAPGEANPWDSRGDILASNGKLDEAIAAYDKSLQIYPSFRQSADKLFRACFHNGQYELANKQLFAWEQECLIDSCPFVSWGRAEMLTYRGQYDSALIALDLAIAAEQNRTKLWQGNPGFLPNIYAEKARLLLELNEPALSEIQKAVELTHIANPDDETSYQVSLTQALIRDGKLKEAARNLSKLKSVLQADQSPLSLYWLGMGYFELAEENLEEAARCFERSANEVYPRNDFLRQYMLGRALLMTGHPERAAKVLEGRVNSFTLARMQECIASSKIYYYLARAYEASGNTGGAIPQYERFLAIWKNADSDLPELADARQRLARLKQNP